MKITHARAQRMYGAIHEEVMQLRIKYKTGPVFPAFSLNDDLHGLVEKVWKRLLAEGGFEVKP